MPYKCVKSHRSLEIFEKDENKICYNTKWINMMRNKIKIIKFFLKKVLCEIKKSYLCTRKTTGRRWEERKEKFLRSSLKEWSNQSLKGKSTRVRSEPYQFKRINPSQDRKRKKRITIYKEEFDPGSGWTLAAGLIHASRTVNALSGAWEWRTGA